MAALAPLFRRALDSSSPATERQRRAALTDLEWAGEVKERGGTEAATLVEELAQYRYGGGEPTSFAVKDALQRTKDLIASAEHAPSAATPEEAA